MLANATTVGRRPRRPGHRQRADWSRARSTRTSKMRCCCGSCAAVSSGCHWTATSGASSCSNASTMPSAEVPTTCRPFPRRSMAWWCEQAPCTTVASKIRARRESGARVISLSGPMVPAGGFGKPGAEWGSRSARPVMCCSRVPPRATLTTWSPRQMATVGTRSSTAACTRRDLEPVLDLRRRVVVRPVAGAVEVGVDVRPSDQQEAIGVVEESIRGLRIQLPRRHDEGLAAGPMHGVQELDAGEGHRVTAGHAGPSQAARDDDAGRHALSVEP